MNLKSIQTAVTSKVGRQVLVAQKHSPTILFAAGVVGVVATTVLAARATLKLEEVLDETQNDLDKANKASVLHPDEYSENDHKKDVVLIYARTAGKMTRLYGPAALVGMASIGCLTGAHLVLNRRNVALTAAYAALDKGFREYRRRVVEEFGEDKDRDLRFGLTSKDILDDECEGEPEKKTVKVIDGKNVSIYARFFDENSSSWNKMPHYNQAFIRCQQSYANDLLNARGHVFLNEIYDMLGLERSKEGAVVGWVKDGHGDGYIDFGVFRGDTYMGQLFVNGDERSILLDFNVDGVIYDLI